MTNAVDIERPNVALIMSGGGARAAYQVGVLRAIARILPRGAPNPFRIVCGTSAGAINAVSLASNIDCFDFAVRQLARAWGNLHIGHVYRADIPGTARTFFRCLRALSKGGRHRPEPISLLDCAPLETFLESVIDFERIRRTISAGHLSALCVTASSYTSGDSISFFKGTAPNSRGGGRIGSVALPRSVSRMCWRPARCRWHFPS